MHGTGQRVELVWRLSGIGRGVSLVLLWLWVDNDETALNVAVKTARKLQTQEQQVASRVLAPCTRVSTDM